jgi:hypothetical protein
VVAVQALVIQLAFFTRSSIGETCSGLGIAVVGLGAVGIDVAGGLGAAIGGAGPCDLVAVEAICAV